MVANVHLSDIIFILSSWAPSTGCLEASLSKCLIYYLNKLFDLPQRCIAFSLPCFIDRWTVARLTAKCWTALVSKQDCLHQILSKWEPPTDLNWHRVTPCYHQTKNADYVNYLSFHVSLTKCSILIFLPFTPLFLHSLMLSTLSRSQKAAAVLDKIKPASAFKSAMCRVYSPVKPRKKDTHHLLFVLGLCNRINLASLG